jgi:hypothetical protein
LRPRTEAPAGTCERAALSPAARCAAAVAPGAAALRQAGQDVVLPELGVAPYRRQILPGHAIRGRVETAAPARHLQRLPLLDCQRQRRAHKPESRDVDGSATGGFSTSVGAPGQPESAVPSARFTCAHTPASAQWIGSACTCASHSALRGSWPPARAGADLRPGNAAGQSSRACRGGGGGGLGSRALDHRRRRLQRRGRASRAEAGCFWAGPWVRQGRAGQGTCSPAHYGIVVERRRRPRCPRPVLVVRLVVVVVGKNVTGVLRRGDAVDGGVSARAAGRRLAQARTAAGPCPSQPLTHRSTLVQVHA